MLTAQNMKGENSFQVGVQIMTYFLHQAAVHRTTRDDTAINILLSANQHRA